MLCPHCGRPVADDDAADGLCCAGASGLWHCTRCNHTEEAFAIAYGLCPQCNGELTRVDTPRPGAASATAVEGVRMAFEIEIGGRAFYQRAAADSTDPTLRALFSRFAVMEGEHMETLSRRYHIDAPAPSRELRVEAAALFAGVERRPQDPANLFRIAIGLEQRAMRFFTERAALAGESSPTRRLYNELAAEEWEHAELLASEYERWQAGQTGRLSNDPHAAPVRPAGATATTINAAALLLDGPDARRTALLCVGGESLDYGTLRDRVARTAAVWRARGVGPGQRVAIKVPDGADWVTAFLGTIWCGAIAVGINPRVPATEWQYILDEAGFSVILAESDADTPTPWRERVMPLHEWRDALQRTAPLASRPMDEDAPAFWCHSSGTSGKPKAVVHGHRFARQIEQVSREGLGIVAGDRLFATSKLFFSYPQTNSLFAGLKLGATVIIDPQWPTAASVAATVAAQRPTVLFSVPSLYRNLLNEGLAPGLVASGVARCVSAGEPLPPSLREAWRAATGIGMTDGYGASETLVLVLTAMAGDDSLQASPGVDVQPLDAAAAASGGPTRLCFRVSTLALGYLDRPAAQAESFRAGAFCPADLFVRSASGWRFAGREDSLVKIKGRWINLVDLEERLAAGTPGLLEAASVTLPDEDGVDAVAVFYVARPGESAAVEAELRERASTLPQYQRPRWLHPVAALPRTPTGKLLRRRLAELVADQG